MNRTNDDDLKRFLDGNDPLAQALRERPSAAPPAALDEAILAAARDELDRPARPRWFVPLSVAATVVLGVGLTVRLQNDVPLTQRTNESVVTRQNVELAESAVGGATSGMDTDAASAANSDRVLSDAADGEASFSEPVDGGAALSTLESLQRKQRAEQTRQDDRVAAEARRLAARRGGFVPPMPDTASDSAPELGTTAAPEAPSPAPTQAPEPAEAAPKAVASVRAQTARASEPPAPAAQPTARTLAAAPATDLGANAIPGYRTRDTAPRDDAEQDTVIAQPIASDAQATDVPVIVWTDERQRRVQAALDAYGNSRVLGESVNSLWSAPSGDRPPQPVWSEERVALELDLIRYLVGRGEMTEAQSRLEHVAEHVDDLTLPDDFPLPLPARP